MVHKPLEKVNCWANCLTKSLCPRSHTYRRLDGRSCSLLNGTILPAAMSFISKKNSLVPDFRKTKLYNWCYIWLIEVGVSQASSQNSPVASSRS